MLRDGEDALHDPQVGDRVLGLKGHLEAIEDGLREALGLDRIGIGASGR